MTETPDPILVEDVLAVLAQFNDERPDDEAIPVSLDASLGRRSGLDSLALITIFAMVEERIKERYGVSLALLEEDNLLVERGPLESVSEFVGFLGDLIARETARQAAAT